jgi:putative Holliday junction resolvase
MGLDVGEKRVGVALSDSMGIIASPSTVLTVSDTDSVQDDILKLACEYDVECIVVGLPRSMDGNLGKQAEITQGFIEKLSRRSDIQVESWDERLSTAAADRAMRELGMKRKKKKEHRDAIAAAIILQSYLEHRRFSSSAADVI